MRARTNTATARQRQSAELPAQPSAEAPLSEWALWCAEVGRITGAWKVFPCAPGEKRPLHKGWQDKAADDPKAVAVMWRNDPQANIGLAIQPGFVVIDGDLYKRGAEAALAAFEKEHGRLPNTLTHATPSGGRHLIYSTSKTLGNGKGTLPDFGDVRGHGGLIVGPGSVFKGKRYTVESLRLPEPLPSHIEGMLCGAKATRKDAREDFGYPIDWDEEQAQRLVELAALGKLIKDYAGPFIEGERDNLTFRLFAEAKGRMIHPDAMLEAVMASGIAGGLEPDVIERKMDSAYYDGNTQDGYGAKVPAYWLPNHVFKPYVEGKPVDREPADPVEWKARNPRKLPEAFPGDPELEPVAATDKPATEVGEHELTAGRFRLVTRDGIELIEPPEWLIPDFVPQHAHAMLIGAPGTFKTFLALDVALSVATGAESSLGLKPRDQGCVLFAVGEGRASLRKRVTAWEQRHNGGRKAGAFLLADPVPHIDEDWAPFIAMARKASPWGYKLVVIDTVGRAMQGANENQQEHASKLTKLVETLQRELGAAVLALHHTGHVASDRARGSSVFGADADTIITATRQGKDYLVSLNMAKQKDAAEWEQPRHVKLAEIGTSLGKSLVAVKPAANEIPKAAARDDTPILRDVHARYILAALRTCPSKRWGLSELATKARAMGCQLSHASLRNEALGTRKGKPGWARMHHALAPYFDRNSETWLTPAKLPQIDPQFELKSDEIQ